MKEKRGKMEEVESSSHRACKRDQSRLSPYRYEQGFAQSPTAALYYSRHSNIQQLILALLTSDLVSWS